MHLKRPSCDICIDELVLDDEISKSPVCEADRIVFRIVYFCTKAEPPTATVNKLLDYDILNGLKHGIHNLSWSTINEMQQIISQTMQTDLVSKLKESDV